MRKLDVRFLALGLAALGAASCSKGASSAVPSAPSESITNTQEAGVDEGGIVKAHGDHLVVLRRGRLFSVEVGDEALRPIDVVDVGPSPRHHAWYDEMLIHDDTIVVVGYSYQSWATEIGLFHIGDDGDLSHQHTFLLRSNDYYSSRNYASRLIGDKLVFYMPHALGYGDLAGATLPSVRDWSPRMQRRRGWNEILPERKILPSIEDAQHRVVHTVVTCDLGPRSTGCSAEGILGGHGRSFYVSPRAVYVWTHAGHSGHRLGDARPNAALYRLPLDGGEIGAVHVHGAPVDQFSFHESTDGHLNVLLRAEARGDAMWSPEVAAGDVGLLRVPLEQLEQRGTIVPADRYVALAQPQGPGAAFHNRFVGDVVLYGQGRSWGPAAGDEGSVYVHRYAEPGSATEAIELPHGVDRIEPLGRDGLIVGTDGQDLHFTTLSLSRRPGIVGRFTQPGASQGELRSHGFFFKPTRDRDGLLGLPVRHHDAPGYAHLFRGSAQVLYLAVDDLQLRALGALEADPTAGRDDRCITSCVDWYGNARPIFYRGRVFALLGYELVEGRVHDGALHETRRIDMSTLLRRQENDTPMPVAG
jgi:hypothetical protein